MSIPFTVWSQTGTTSLHGTVLDKSHAAVADAKVSLVNEAQSIHRDETTPATGDFEFHALPPGTYRLTVEKEGFNKYEQSNVQLLVNVANTVNVVLQVGSVATQIEVSSQAETINTTDASLGIAFNAKRWKMPWSEGQSLQFRWEVSMCRTPFVSMFSRSCSPIPSASAVARALATTRAC